MQRVEPARRLERGRARPFMQRAVLVAEEVEVSTATLSSVSSARSSVRGAKFMERVVEARKRESKAAHRLSRGKVTATSRARATVRIG
jgi:hypothetical protein